MKKYNLYLWLAALVGLFASCSQDENAMLQTNESNRVSLTAELPDDFAQIGTRALLPTVDNHTLRCILEVWTEDGTTLKHREEQINLSSNNVVFDFTIDAGTYDCLFWADFIAKSPGEDGDAKIGEVKYTHYADKYYKTDDAASGLKAISIIDTEYDAGFNTDARDAFFGNYVLEKGAAAIENPEINALTRPFAKLTIKEKNATNYNDCSGLTAEYNVPKTFNVSTAGVVAGSTVKVTCNNKSSESLILFSDYIFTDATSNLGEVTLNFTGSGKTFQDVIIPAGIPLKRNFKTNATGNLITVAPAPTNSVKMTVTMDADWGGADVEEDVAPKWDGESTAQPTSYTGNSQNIVYITSAAELAWLAKECNGGNEFENYTFNLTTDIDLNNHEWTPIGNVDKRFSGNFNGQGHTVRNMKVDINVEDDFSAGFIGYMQGKSNNLLKVSNLIVEGNVKAAGTGGMGRAGGICGYALYVNIEFCRFNGTVSGTGTMSKRYGGILGEYGGNNEQSLTCCISDAEVTSAGGDEGGLVGYLANGPVTYSAWNSSRTMKGVGVTTLGDFADTNKSFTTIAELNELLGDMNNNSKPGSEYKWQAGDDAYPILVRNDNN